jgi:threonine dehydrogenase-like Zn-dependent dehydrogenase
MQAEKVRVPFANVGLVKLPGEISDAQGVLLSDILPTAYFATILAEIERGNTVAVFGAGPVGLLAIAGAWHLGAGRIFAVDSIPSRLEMARQLGAEVIDFEKEDPVETLKRLTGGIGVDRAIDAVGVDANHAHHGPAKKGVEKQEALVKQVAPKTNVDGDNWHPGDAPTQALAWAVGGLAKAGTLAIVGVYPQTVESFPIGQAMNKNLTLKMGNCNHRKYIPELIELVRAGAIDPSAILTQARALDNVIEAFKAFDKREPGWIKVGLELAST